MTSLSSPSGPPATLSVPEKKVISVRCAITVPSSAVVRVINWYLGDRNVTHLSQFLMEYSAASDEYSSLSILTLNVSRELHGHRLTCLCEGDGFNSANRPIHQVTALLDVMCKSAAAVATAAA